MFVSSFSKKFTFKVFANFNVGAHVAQRGVCKLLTRASVGTVILETVWHYLLKLTVCICFDPTVVLSVFLIDAVSKAEFISVVKN